MARQFVFLAFALFVGLTSKAQTNVSFVGQLSYQQLRNSDLANIWGYTDEFGTEYALIGVNGEGGNTGGISVVDLSDPADPQEVFFLPGPTSIWREIKVWDDHAYVTTEASGGGLTIVDLSPLPQSTELPSTVFLGEDWDTSHALFIDENGRLYLFGANAGNGGAIMYDLSQDPMAPVEVGRYDPSYIHDGYARGDTLYAGHIINGYFTIVDVSDPSVPVLLGQRSTPNFFTHNVWLDASGDHLFTTDERENAYVASYDISDPSDIQFLDKLQSDPGSNAIPHNTYWLPGGYVVQSYYTYGVSIYDASRPDNLVEVGHYDTSPVSGGGFFGAWGVYPFFNSGRLIISDIEEGLFVLDPTYVRACWLEGSITDAVSSVPVNQATLSISGTTSTAITGFDGAYGTGYVEPGTFTVTVAAPGYFPATVTGVVLETGVVTLLDVQLDPLPTYSVSGRVRTTGTNAGVPGAQVWMKDNTYTFQTLSDADGNFTFPAVYSGSYAVDCGQWGWHNACPPDQVVGESDILDRVIDLDPGYADDFALDQNWQVQTTAARGAWTRGDPAGTMFEGQRANPEDDVTDDCRAQAFITGNSGGNPSSDDVDEGGTLLTSPVFDATGMEDPHIRFAYWFFNAGGSSSVDDALVISLTDGTDTLAIQTTTAPGAVNISAWRYSNIRIADHLAPNNTMRLLVYTADEAPNGHLVEAGLDDFSVVPNATVGIAGTPSLAAFELWPNPAADRLNIRLPEGEEALIEILDVAGRVVLTGSRTRGGLLQLGVPLPSGTYIVRATGISTTYTRRVVISN